MRGRPARRRRRPASWSTSIASKARVPARFGNRSAIGVPACECAATTVDLDAGVAVEQAQQFGAAVPGGADDAETVGHGAPGRRRTSVAHRARRSHSYAGLASPVPEPRASPARSLGALAQPLGLAALLLGPQPPFLRTPGRARRPPDLRGLDRLADERREPGEGGLAVLVLAALLGALQDEHPVLGDARREPVEHPLPLGLGQRRGRLATSQRSSTLESVVLTPCPPGPDERDARTSSSVSGSRRPRSDAAMRHRTAPRRDTGAAPPTGERRTDGASHLRQRRPPRPRRPSVAPSRSGRVLGGARRR